MDDKIVQEPIPKYNYILPEEYLAMERTSVEKHEYYKGEVFAMAGASYNHVKISNNLFKKALPFLDGKSCNIYNSDLRIHIPENGLYTYPDASIICGEPVFTQDGMDNATNPAAIFEILSKSTREYDRIEKFSLYRSIKSFVEYILIDSLQKRVEYYTKNNDNSWTLFEYKNMTDSFTIKTIGLLITMEELYKDIIIQPTNR